MEKHAAEQAVILIPSLEPDQRLPAYIQKLKEGGFAHIVVIDDGSGEAYRPIFDEVDAVENTVVLRHEVNRGKGVALKTGYTYIIEHLQDITGVITADADGQHTVKDCLRMAEQLESGKRALYLGSRDFNLENIPPKSRSGNKITSTVFKLLYGQYLPDTQTGLRAFRKEELPFMAEVEGERYEYEMKVLIACSRAKIPMIPITIETIYENANEGTHFHPVRDSWRIYKVILGSFFKFMASSLTCWAIDQGLFNLINKVILNNADDSNKPAIFISKAVARVVSGIINFTLNKKYVFGDKDKSHRAFIRYIILWSAILLLSSMFTTLFSLLGINSTITSIIVDMVLYFVSYRFQESWVFREDVPHE